jgi:hypothetical protein
LNYLALKHDSVCRLETFDRPIKQEPEHFGDRKDALIGEFENYLGILKAVHSGADLQAAAKNAGGQLPGAAKGHVGYVLASRGSRQVRHCGAGAACHACIGMPFRQRRQRPAAGRRKGRRGLH